METDIKVLSTTEYEDGRMIVSLELSERGKELLIEAGLNSILINSLSNFRDEEIEEEDEFIQDDEGDDEGEFDLLYNSIKEKLIKELYVDINDAPGRCPIKKLILKERN